MAVNVTYEDVAVSLGRPITSADEQAQITQWVRNAAMLIRARLGDPDLLDGEAVEYVVTEAVVAKVKNPDGKQNERIDDYSYGLSSDLSSGHIHITDAWWDLLKPNSSGGGFSVRPTFTPDRYTGHSGPPHLL